MILIIKGLRKLILQTKELAHFGSEGAHQFRARALTSSSDFFLAILKIKDLANVILITKDLAKWILEIKDLADVEADLKRHGS